MYHTWLILRLALDSTIAETIPRLPIVIRSAIGRIGHVLALLFISDPGNFAPPATTPPIALAQLMLTKAKPLDGEVGEFVVSIESRPVEYLGYTIYNCLGIDGVHRSLWLERGQWLGEGKLNMVRGRIELICHDRAVFGGAVFDGFTEFRIVRAILHNKEMHTISACCGRPPRRCRRLPWSASVL